MRSWFLVLTASVCAQNEDLMAVAKVNVTVGVGAAILMLIIDDPTFQQKSSAFGGYSWNAAAGRKAGNWGVSPKSPMSSGKVG